MIELTGKAYFASDFHLGAPNHAESLVREKKIVRWLDFIEKDCAILFLCGDLFDFWFEYTHVVPKGFTRLLGKVSSMVDKGTKLFIFPGNHDMWMSTYLQQECGAVVIRKPQQFDINGVKLYVAHGDGFGDGDYAYKKLKLVFENTLCRFLFKNMLHPDAGMYLGNKWATNSWKRHRKKDDVYHFESPEKEILFGYAQSIEATQHHDLYVFGHRHYLLDLPINQSSRYINLGDWIHFFSYGVLENQDFNLHQFERREPIGS